MIHHICSELQNSFGVLEKTDQLYKLYVDCKEVQTRPEVSRTRTLTAPAIQKTTPEFEQTND